MTIETLTFGAELECIMPQGLNQQGCADAINTRLNGSNTCKVVSYHTAHMTTPYWKLTTDGSLGDYTYGIEVVSPILHGTDADLAQLDAVCGALTDLGCTVTRRCGFHVHVGSNLDLPTVKKTVRLYQAYEPIIDSFMPASRRAGSNQWSATLTTATVAAIDNATNKQDLARVIHRATGAANIRYHKVNCASRHPTIEFRHHSGTVDARKARNWVLTCLRMVDAAKGDLPLGTATTNPINTARPGSKAHQIGEMLLRPEGATGPEICAAMGWPSVSVPAQARAAGLEVYSSRMGRVVRYRVRRAQAESAPALDLTVAGFCRLIGSSDTETNYLETRANNLRSAAPWAA